MYVWCKAALNSLQPNLHAQGLLPGTVPDAWLLEHGRVICPHCSHLVARSHIASHLTKCKHNTIPSTVTPLLDTNFILPSFEDICKLRCSTIRHIPAKSRPAFALVLSATLRSALSTNDEVSWLKLFLLPKCVLVSSKRRGRHHKPMPIGHLCNLWSEGRFDALWEHATHQAHLEIIILSSAVQDKVSSLPYSLPRRGCMARLVKHSPPQVLPLLLQSKHPKGTPPTAPSMEALDSNILPPDFDILSVLRSFPKATACGPTGLRIQHLVDAAEVPMPTSICSSLRDIEILLIYWLREKSHRVSQNT